jgi:ABC-type Mn2+/Zn2+ transport system permease subunit
MGTPIMSAIVTARTARTAGAAGADAVLDGVSLAVLVNAAIVLSGTLIAGLFLRGKQQV